MAYTPPGIRTVKITRYIAPLREGGSLPAIAEADDEFLYVVKFRGAGQGSKALIADLIGGELARAAGLKVPEMVYAELHEGFGRTEPDEEIQDLLKASIGLNLGVHFLSESITYDPAVNLIDPTHASMIVWLDALLTNVDRTAKNTNMLTRGTDLWLIDHGASLYFHHSWDTWEEQCTKPFAPIANHVLLPQATEIGEIDSRMKQLLSAEIIKAVIDMVPDEWLQTLDTEQTPDERRAIYYQFLMRRMAQSAIFVNQAQNARAAII